MASLALKHKARVMAAQKEKKPAEKAPAEHAKKLPGLSAAKSKELTELKGQLEGDLVTLKKLSGDEEKAPFKEDLIEKYRKLCESYIHSHQNWARLDVLFWWFMWRNDIEGFESVQPDMYKGVEHGLTTPNDWSRDFQTLYLDEVFKYTEEAVKEEVDFNSDFIIDAVKELENGQMVTTPILKAKLYKLLGQVYQGKGDNKAALAAYEKALDLNDKVGVKTVIKELQAKVNENE